MHSFKKGLVLGLLLIHGHSVYAIPPPEALAMMGGSILYPGLLFIGIFGLFFKYLWVKTKLYLFYRRYALSVNVVLMFSLLMASAMIPWFIWEMNPPVLRQESIAHWQQLSQKPLILDLRVPPAYEKAHFLGSIFVPGEREFADFLKNNPNKTILLVCEVGIRSSGRMLHKEENTLLQKANDEQRVSFFPGGFRAIMRMGSTIGVPIIITLPPTYASQLLKKQNFVGLNYSGDGASEFISNFERIKKKGATPIIHSHVAPERMAETLKQLKEPYFYFAPSLRSEPSHLKSLLLLIFVLCGIFIVLRWRELFHRAWMKPTTWFLWIYVVISLFTTLVALQSENFTLSIPYDRYLHKIGTNLPMNFAYPLFISTFLGLLLLIYLMYPSSFRMQWLRLKLSNVFALREHDYFFKRPTVGQLLITGFFVQFVYDVYLPSSLLLLGLLLLPPILADVLIFTVLCCSKTSSLAKRVLKQSGYPCSSEGDPSVILTTHHDLDLARFYLRFEDKTISVGLFSALGEKGQFADYADLIRNLLLFFQQDIVLHLDESDRILSIKLLQNYKSPGVVNRHQLLQQHHMVPDAVTTHRFSSFLLQEVFDSPMPLTLDVLKERWNKKGGCHKALRKLGLLAKFNEKNMAQVFALSHRLYIDSALEQTLFSVDKWSYWIRRKIVQFHLTLAIETLYNDCRTLIQPRAAIRMSILIDALEKPLSVRQLKRVILKALAALCRESALWQSHCAVLHQHCFKQLQDFAEKTSTDLTFFITNPSRSVYSLSLSSCYGLSSKQSAVERFENPLPEQKAFFVAEVVRGEVRTLQLREWQLLSLLIEKLTEKLALPISLAYLCIADFQRLPRRQDKLMALLTYRFESWQIQNQRQFPEIFSLKDCEEALFRQTEVTPKAANPIRVAGNQPIIMGQAVFLQKDTLLETLPKQSILIADNVSPEQLIQCLHIQGVILQKGGYLSHVAIIAREKNMPMVVQFQISTLHEKDNILIKNANQVVMLSNKALGWVFLDEASAIKDLGNKARRLAMFNLKTAHLPSAILLPSEAVVKVHQWASSNTLKASEVLDELDVLFDFLSQQGAFPLIVRSSANMEDSSERSYAGLFYSEANLLTTNDLVVAICKARQHAMDHADVLKRYGGETPLVLNLIVQQYIQGEFGGVLFTKSSQAGLMHVEIAEGGAVGVTDGSAPSASLYIDEMGESTPISGESACLGREAYRLLYQLGRELESLFGKPQDIEWVIAAGQLYLIQSRDITEYTLSSPQ